MWQLLKHQLRLVNSLATPFFVRNILATTSTNVASQYQPQLLYTVQPVRWAGHSHWKNIKHIKEAKDAEKQKVTLAVMQRIRVAVREGGGTNPKLNSTLARVMDDGKTKDVPMNTMTELLRKMEKSKEVKGSQVFVEAKGINNCMLIIETYTDRPKWTRQIVQHVMKKYGGTIGESGTSNHFFNLKGIVYLPIEESSNFTKDEALEAAIECGAEDVIEGFDDYDRPAFQFICDSKETHSVKKALLAKGLQVGAARQEFIANSHVRFDDHALKTASDMLDELQALDEVVRIYDNIASVSEPEQLV